MKARYFILFLCLAVTVACEDVVDLDLPEGESLLQVDGFISAEDTLHFVRVSRTLSYNASGDFPPVMATVVLQDDKGRIDTLREESSGNGLYIIDRPGVVGNTYTLSIFTNDGQQYQSQPELLAPVTPIDSIYLEEDEFQEDEYFVVFDTSDPVGLGNYYRWKQYIDDSYQNKAENLTFASDEFVEGNPIFGISITESVALGKKVKIEQLSISKRNFEYLDVLRSQTAFVGSIFDPPPAPIVGNLFNVNNPDEVVAGFFSASDISSATIVVRN